MINNITYVQLVSIAFIILPIAVLVINNRFFSAIKTSSQLWLLATLGLALVAAEKNSVFVLALSVSCFVVYSITLCQYYVAALNCSRKHERLPHCKRP